MLNKRGMTIIEIMLVIALLGLLLSAAIPRFNRITRENIRSGTRKYVALVRLCYDQAILTGRLHRISLNLRPEHQSWLLEIAKTDKLPEEEIKEDLGTASASSASSTSSSQKPDTGFDDAKMSGSHVKPNGIRMVYAESWRLGDKKRITDGELAIYCFPNGFIDDSSIALQEDHGENNPLFILKTQSLTGRVKLEVVSEKKY